MRYELPKVTIFCECDGWDIEWQHRGYPKCSESWNHNDVEFGVGGECKFAQILQAMGFDVECKDVY